MSDKRRYIYWDASLFLHLLGADAEVVPVLVEIIQRIKGHANFRIVTSAFSIVEVAFNVDERASGTLTPEFETRVEQMWADTALLHLADFDRDVGRLARNLIRVAVGDGRALKPIDAIHLATASMVGADMMLTTDQRLIKRGREAGIPIRLPDDSVLDLLRRS